MSKNYLARVLKKDGSTVGCAFLITQRHLLTCSHVVNYIFEHTSKPNESFNIEFPAVPNSRIKVKVCKEYWYPDIPNHSGVRDITILEIESNLPKGCKAGVFVNTKKNGRFIANGFPKDVGAEERITHGKVIDSLSSEWLQAEAEDPNIGHHIQPGFSGTPAVQESTGHIIGMIAAYNRDETTREGFIIPTDCLYQALGLSKNWIDTEKTVWATEIFELNELIADTDIQESTLQLFLHQFLPEFRPPNDTERKSLKHFLCFLAQVQHISSDQAPLFEFLEFIHSKINPEFYSSLVNWKEKVAGRLNINVMTIEARINHKKQQIDNNELPLIFFEIEPKGLISTVEFILKTSIYQNKVFTTQENDYTPRTIKELEVVLPEILSKIKISLKTDAIIEILLPITLFNWNINHILVNRGRSMKKPLGQYYSFNIRSWDRVRNYEKLYGDITETQWKRKWKIISDLSNIETEHIYCISDSNTCCDILLDELEQTAIVFMPLFTLSSFEDDILNVFDVAIAAGLPFIFWIPQSIINNQKKQETKSLIRSCPHEDWMTEIQEKKRQQAYWNDFMVLWDNPERPVPKPELFSPNEL